ncbi:MAG TPA: DUF1697 domain-containing protein [Solirubrobacteraceae bacterium]|nr:DUF1697 domain-containing protein [Solirubrobacteraceae bacterium]
MQQVIMLRGINLGAKRRVPMADLRALFGEAGFRDVRTYVQSGNIVLESTAKPAALEGEAATLISERFGFDVPVVVRTARQLAAVVKLNPLGDVASDPKRYQVSFLSDKPGADVVRALKAGVTGDERVALHGREIYAWHPDGVARSKLWNALAGKGLGVTATARNWTTVTTLLEMAGG